VLSVLLVVWLVIGCLAAYQRGYFGPDREVSCRTFVHTSLTIVAGPLNYFGVNPKVSCQEIRRQIPREPSSAPR